ncbi:hypothetical protein V8E51_014306 [Hyaloscypha variabilis]
MAGNRHPSTRNPMQPSGGNGFESHEVDQHVTGTKDSNLTARGSHEHSRAFGQRVPSNTDATATGAYTSNEVQQNMPSASNFNNQMGRIPLDDPLRQVISGVVYSNSLQPFGLHHNSSMNHFGAPTYLPESSQHTIQYPNSNSYPSIVVGSSQNIQSQGTTTSRMFFPNSKCERTQLQNQPLMTYPNHHKSSTSRNPLATAALEQANSNTGENLDEESDLEEDYLHPDTGRPVRTLLDHETVLLKQFFVHKNPFTAVPSKRQLKLWQLGLPNKVQNEWIQFVLSNQTPSEAEDREEMVEEYRAMITAMKNKVYAERKSVLRGNRHGMVGRPAGSKNKPKDHKSTKKGAGVSKATPAKGSRAKKWKNTALQQLLDSYDDEDNDYFDSDEQIEDDEEMEEDQ